MTEAEKAPAKNGAKTPAQKRFKGCVAVFLILAAIIVAVPVTLGTIDYVKTRAERRILVRLYAYREAQYTYHSKDRDNDGQTEYARDYTALVGFKFDAPAAAGGEKKVRVDEAMATARGEKGKPLHGYVFREMFTIWKIPINWDGDFAICATPARYAETGRKTYIMKTDGDVWSKDLGESRLLSDYPNELESNGWKKIEPERD